MNVKLVIAWVFAIIVFAIFGVFGYMNRDLLVKDDSNTDFTPIVNNEVIVHNCNKETNKGTLNYKYIVRDNKIEKQRLRLQQEKSIWVIIYLLIISII